jgi:hypothetical protein
MIILFYTLKPFQELIHQEIKHDSQVKGDGGIIL